MSGAAQGAADRSFWSRLGYEAPPVKGYCMAGDYGVRKDTVTMFVMRSPCRMTICL